MRAGTVGIALSRFGVEAFHRRGSGRGANRSAAAQVASGEPLIHPLSEGRLSAALAQLVAQLPRAAIRPDVPVMVGVPDPLVREDLFAFRDFPGDRKEAGMLVAARAAREHQCCEEDLICAHQVVEATASGVSVLVRSMERRLRDAIEAAANAAGLRITQLEAHAVYKARCAELARLDSGHALVWLTGEAWTIECHSERSFFSESGWIGDAEVDAALIARLIRSFRIGNPQGDFSIFIDGPSALGDRLNSACAAWAMECSQIEYRSGGGLPEMVGLWHSSV